MTFSNMQLIKNMSSCFCIIYYYMTSFETITSEEYQRLIDNEKKYLI